MWRFAASVGAALLFVGNGIQQTGRSHADQMPHFPKLFPGLAKLYPPAAQAPPGVMTQKSAAQQSQQPSCSSLVNHGTHSTIQIEVGTPGQKFDVVADTGSDNVIVMSCVCQDMKHCSTEDKCFRGGNRSQTFSMMGAPGGKLTENAKIPVIVMAFGSGPIEAVIGTDVVKVGSVSTQLKDGLLMMVDQSLQINGPFEGILGLGLPKKGDIGSEQKPGGAEKMKAKQSPFAGMFPPGIAGGMPGGLPGGLPFPGMGGQAPEEHIKPPGFLEAANIGRFSICFNEKADGVLRLNTPPSAKNLGSVGQVHWGLDFRGISVGQETAPVQFCTEAEMQSGQKTPCGAIPDSGTTVMMAPKPHLFKLFTMICDNWERCQKAAAGGKPKHEVFQALLSSCSEWMTPEEGLNSLPPLHFHMQGPDGTKQTLRLPGASYVAEAEGQEVLHVTKHLMGIFPVEIVMQLPGKKKVCTPAFGVHDYNTQANGPVWIFGTPFFYRYQVGYDLHASPPTMSFLEEPCGQCADGTGSHKQVALFSQDGRVMNSTEAIAARDSRARPLRIRGPLRVPHFDTSLPL